MISTTITIPRDKVHDIVYETLDEMGYAWVDNDWYVGELWHKYAADGHTELVVNVCLDSSADEA